MTSIFTIHPLETPEIAELRRSINAADKELQEYVQAARLIDRAQSTRYNELMLAQRPSFPTSEQVAAIAVIAEMVRSGTQYGDVHGNSDAGILPRTVTFSSKERRINVRADSPSKAGSMDLVWEFTPEETTAFLDAISTNGLTVFSQWECLDGLAFVVAALPENPTPQ